MSNHLETIRVTDSSFRRIQRYALPQLTESHLLNNLTIMFIWQSNSKQEWFYLIDSWMESYMGKVLEEIIILLERHAFRRYIVGFNYLSFCIVVFWLYYTLLVYVPFYYFSILALMYNVSIRNSGSALFMWSVSSKRKCFPTKYFSISKIKLNSFFYKRSALR